jgi:hypothetical protein
MIKAIGKPKPYSVHRVYLAGDMSGYGWRDIVIQKLPRHVWDTLLIVKTDCFDYVGPFFGPSIKPDLPKSYLFDHDSSDIGFSLARTLGRVQERFKQGIDICTVLLAYIDTQTTLETLLEIGLALNAKKHVVVCFSPTVDHKAYEECLDGAHYCLSVTPEHIPHILIDINDWIAGEGSRHDQS